MSSSPLAQLVPDLVPGLALVTDPEVVAYSPSMLLAHCCTVNAEHDAAAKIMLVYRSVLVKDTSTLYHPVAQRILTSPNIDILLEASVEDEGMMFGQAEVLIIGASIVAPQPTYLQTVRTRLEEKVHKKFGGILASPSWTQTATAPVSFTD